MNSAYTFVRLDADLEQTQITLVCLNDDDAVLVAGRLGAIEVWDGARQIGGAPRAAERPPEPPRPLVQMAPPALVAAPRPEPLPQAAQPPQPVETTPAIARAYNPFRRESWRRRGQ
jgi:hypothetical protein